MATSSVSKPARASAPSPVCESGYTDDTGPRIRAYLASVQPLEGNELPDAYRRGRALIERIARSANGDAWPALELSPAECADVLGFIGHSEPVDPSTWWQDRDDAPSHVCGYMQVLYALEQSLRAAPMEVRS